MAATNTIYDAHELLSEHMTKIAEQSEAETENGALFKVEVDGHDLKVLHLYGNAYERGVAQGRLIGEQRLVTKRRASRSTTSLPETHVHERDARTSMTSSSTLARFSVKSPDEWITSDTRKTPPLERGIREPVWRRIK